MALMNCTFHNVLKLYNRRLATILCIKTKRESSKTKVSVSVSKYKTKCLNPRKPYEYSDVDLSGTALVNKLPIGSYLTRWENEKQSKVKWKFLEHRGPVFASPYEPLPKHVKFVYDGKEMDLSYSAEEVAVHYAKMLNHEYTSKTVFNINFFQDWRKTMNEAERSTITDFQKCNFQKIHSYLLELVEKQKLILKENKKKIQEKNKQLLEKYGYCVIDGRKEKIANFKLEPPGLFRGRGAHPKMGRLKKRIEAEDIIINCSKDSKIPEPPPGHMWKEVRHDPTVVWLAAWNDHIQNKVKYIMLNPSSKLRSEMDILKYETARTLNKHIDRIREQYQKDWRSEDLLIKQRAVALYFIDRLALRAGYEKDDDELDTAGCCSLRTEHIKLEVDKDDGSCFVIFDFIGKDAIRYYNKIPVEKPVLKNLKLFMTNKRPDDYLFDLLNTYNLNQHLNTIMKNLTAKVFRTYNASSYFQRKLNELTNPEDSINDKLLSYSKANRAVAILCNHQRTPPKNHENQVKNIERKINTKNNEILCIENKLQDVDMRNRSMKQTNIYQKNIRKLKTIKEQLVKLEIQKINKDENKTVALSTSKLNYIDPRISVAWCKRYKVPIEKVYNKTEREKFHWALDGTSQDFQF